MFDSLIPPNHRILVIDDNPSIHADFRKLFKMAAPKKPGLSGAEAALFDPPAETAERPAFEVDFAWQGEEGFARIAKAAAQGRPYAVAFIDMRMPPGWDGMETAMKLWKNVPDLQMVLCTAYSDYSWEEMLENFGHTDRLLLLKKPFDTLEVLQLAHSLTEKWRLGQLAHAKAEHLEKRVGERTHELQLANAALHAEMAGRAAVEETLRQTQKMEAVGQLAAGVAHDFNNLLSVIRGYSGILLEQPELGTSALEAIREVDNAADRAANLTRQLLTFSRRQVIQPEYLDLNEVIEQVSKLLRRLLGETVSLEVERANDLPVVLADRGMVEQLILNLAVNARDAMPRGGALVLRTETVILSAAQANQKPSIRAGRFACLSVIDCGSGIAPETMPRLFEPFFTTKEVGKGTGLGLATVYGIVRQHEGWIEVESSPGCGATFKVFLPETTPPERELPSTTALKAALGHETILVVEDDVCLRNLAQIVLTRFGYRVHTAGSGLEALGAWPAYGAEVDLLLTDMVMPDGVSGRELAARLQAVKPTLKVIFTSGYSQELSDANGLLEEGLNFLRKPYPPARLGAAVRGCLDSAARTTELVA